jgi:hypothetical protein
MSSHFDLLPSMPAVDPPINDNYRVRAAAAEGRKFAR